MSQNEAVVRKFLRDHDVRAQDEVPSFVNPLTGSPATPDFFIPSPGFYIEVKGLMTFKAIRIMAHLARAKPNYYLYQADDYDWRPKIDHWPLGSLTPLERKQIEGGAARAMNEHSFAHPPRTKANKLFSAADREHSKAFQRQEILVMAKSPKAAKAASRVTLERLRAYAEFLALEMHALELLDISASIPLPVRRA